MKISINGEGHELVESLTISELLQNLMVKGQMVKVLTFELTGLALAVNQTIVPQEQWHHYQLSDGDEIALFRAIAGG